MSSNIFSAPRTASASRAPRAASPVPKILCIDDDPAVGRFIQIHLQNYRVEILNASYGTHGYWEALVHRPDVVITDLRMPQGSGDYVVECLKRNMTTRNIPVIVLTGRRSPTLQRYLEALGIARYFVKPLPFSELYAELQRHLPLEPRETESAPSESDDSPIQ